MKSLLDEFREYAKKAGLAQDCFIVGGTVRDILMGLRPRDIDIAIKDHPARTARKTAITIPRKFARKAGASFVILDEKFRMYRVVRGEEHIDFSAMRGSNIEDDLAERDITINALAIPLLSRRVIDPLGGANDLFKGRIKMVSEKNLRNDPLRILRVYRFSGMPGFRTEKDTARALKRVSPLLVRPAPERITDEIKQILLGPNSRKVLERMYRDGALNIILPGLRRRSLRALKVLEAEWRRFPFYKELGKSVDLLSLKFSILLRGAGERGFSRLVLSNMEKELINRIFIYGRMLRFFYKADPKKQTLVKILRNGKDEIFSYLLFGYSYLLSANNHRAERFIEFSRKLLKLYIKEVRPKLDTRLITGDDLIEMGLRPGPEFKRILDRVEVLYLSGGIKKKDEALKTAKHLSKEKR